MVILIERNRPLAVLTNKNVFESRLVFQFAIFIRRTEASKGLASSEACRGLGNRDFEYDFLASSDLQSISWNEIVLDEPHFMLVPWDYSNRREFQRVSLKSSCLFTLMESLRGVMESFFQPCDKLLKVNNGRQREFVQPIAYRPFRHHMLSTIYKKP